MFLSIKNLNVYYGQTHALKDINLDIENADVVAILGPNGSGKSTLLKSIIGLKDFSGQIELNGIKITKSKSRIGYMPQTGEIDKTFPLTVIDVVSMSRMKMHSRFQPILNSAEKEQILFYLSILQIDNLVDENIDRLSGGQLQRVLLARTLAQNGDLILLDEPTNEVDVTTEELIIKEVGNLKKSNKTILITTHDLQLAKRIANKTLFINKEIIAFGKTEDVFTKENLVKTFGDKIIILDKENDITFNDNHGH